ncbi:MAG: nucleotidyltransferase domain-containing protein [Promethearchaeota archaeon]
MESAKYTGRLKEILERKEKRKEILEKELLFLVKQLIKFGAKKIVLFGSLRENNIDFNSDIDLLVIMPSSKPGKNLLKN